MHVMEYEMMAIGCKKAHVDIYENWRAVGLVWNVTHYSTYFYTYYEVPNMYKKVP